MITLKEHFLINIRPNKVRVENLITRESVESGEELVFGNNRLLITDTNEPEQTLKQLINKLSSDSLLTFSRTLVINPYHPNISEFTDVEKMAFRDMAVNLGAKMVRFKFGENVTSKQLDLASLATQTEV